MVADQLEDFFVGHHPSYHASLVAASEPRVTPASSISAAVRPTASTSAQRRRQPHRVGDSLGLGAAVPDHGDPAQAEQDCAAGCVGVQAAAQAPSAGRISNPPRARQAAWRGPLRGSRR